MARRKKRGGIPRFVLVGIGIAVIVGGLFLVYPDEFSRITSLVQPTEFISDNPNPESWQIPAVFYFAISTFDGVGCWIELDITQRVQGDSTFKVLDDDTGQGISVFELVGVRTDVGQTVELIKVNPKLSCQDTSGEGKTITLAGGLITMEAFIDTRRIDGSTVDKKVFSQTKSVVNLNRNLNTATGGGQPLPSFVVNADLFENAINAPSSLSNALVNVVFSSSNNVNIKIDGTILKTGNIVAVNGGLLRFVNPNFGSEPPPPDFVKGTQVILDSIDITEYHYIGSSGVVPAGVTSGGQIVTENRKMKQTSIGHEDNWTASEGLPVLQYKNPRNAVVAIIDFATSGFPKDIGGGITQFKRAGFSIPVTITDANIDINKGVWKVEMFQTGRNSFDSRTFVLKDSRPNSTPVPPTPIPCDPPKLIINGICKLPDVTPPPNPIECTSSTDLLIAFREASDEQLIGTYNDLKPKFEAGTLDKCEENSWILVQAELTRRGIDPEQGIITPTGSAVSFIRYENFYTDLEGNVGGGGGCPDQAGQVPADGIPIVGFQLFGIGICDNFRFSQVVLTPTLDFGSKVNDIQISSIQIQQDIFLAKNNPFPSQPVITCSGKTASSIGTCAITNYVITQSGIPSVFLTSGEAPKIGNFVDKATSGEYQISRVSLQENALVDKVKATGTGLNNGDELSVLYVIWGKIRGTDNTVAFVRDFEAMTYVVNFAFSQEKITCDAPSTIVSTCTVINELTGEEQCTEQCTAPPTAPTCMIPPNKLLPDGTCVPDDPMCLDGEVFNDATNSCEPSECTANGIPMCLANEVHQITTELDDCKDLIIICVPETPVNGNGNGNGTGCADDEFRDQFDVCVPVDPNDGCPDGQNRNSAGVCEKTGTLQCPKDNTGTFPNCVPPKGTNCEEGETQNKDTGVCERDFCKLDASFNLLQCISSLLAGAPTGTIGGTTLLGIVIFAVVIIAIIVIAVVVRRRGGGIRGL